MRRMVSSSRIRPLASSSHSSSKLRSKCSSMARLPRPITMRMSVMPEATASSTTYWMTGVSTIGSISLGCDFVAGRKRVPKPAAGMTALVIFMVVSPDGTPQATGGSSLSASWMR